MPCTVTAFSVKIISPGGAAIKGEIAREVLHDWNSSQGWTEKRVLLPQAREEDGSAKRETDLLVVFVCASQSGAGQAPSSLPDSEIEGQLKAGRPVLIYVSEGRMDFSPSEALDESLLRQRLPREVVIESFKDEKELRSKFAQQLQAILRYHAYFRIEAEVSELPTLAPMVHEAHREYSKSAQALLMGACDDPEAYLARMKDNRGVKIQVNGRQYVEPGNPDSARLWDEAFNELIEAGLIRDAGCNGQLYQVSGKGFEFLETLGKYPIGYIAELGGM